MALKGKVCVKGLWDESIPDITFNEQGVSNYCVLQEKMMADYPKNDMAIKKWEGIVKSVKAKGGNKYNCVIGVSGGVDSSYLLHIAKEYGLKPLAVHLDNGFNSEIAVRNIENVTRALDIDLVTHVIDYEEIKDLLRSYMKASMPWIDFPTDLAIKGTMYNVALKYGIKYIIRGNDFRSEGKQPAEWTYSDNKQLLYLHKQFGSGIKLKTFPQLSIFKEVYAGYIKGIRDVRPYYYINYNKQDAKKLLIEKYSWQDYGGHHHENLFTKFAMSYWLPKKFKIDKRIINLSAQVLSGAIKREEALNKIDQPFDTEDNLESLKDYVLKKLDLSDNDFTNIMSLPPKTYKSYPSDYDFIFKNVKHFKWLIKRIYDFKPMAIESSEVIDGKANAKN
ncbi:MAG: N-acetyl sugar amidotransferase [Bacteroidia bacterium]|nr:N-acetyl sugar amidotransferase [Bacteroidia bacterium]